MKFITDINLLDPDRHYTYADYLLWRFKERIELIRGKVFRMSPAPSSVHQSIVTVLVSSFHQFLKHNTCKVFPASFDVRLPGYPGEEDKDTETIVQPDITVICDLEKIDEKGCKGAPDLIVEVLSPNSVSKDLHEKYEVYEKAGVREYWVVHPVEKTIIAFILKNGKFQTSKPLTVGDQIFSMVLPGFSISLEEIFQDSFKEPEPEYEAKTRRLDP
jgi:Uma2 family endonuclease